MGSDGWTLKRFNHCADLIRDTVRPSDVSGLPYIGLEHIAEGQLTLTGFGSAEQVTSIKSRFRKGDILFGKLRPYFRKVVIAPFDGVCSTDIWVVRQKQGIDQRYLFYWMASNEFIEESTRASEGTRMPRAQWEFVGRIEKSIPPLPEQRAIAHILGTLDDKIELNRRMNQTLEEMARAIFKSWFVDFDPVRAKAAVRREHPDWSNAQVSRAACPNLKPEIAELFPDEFENSELGEIPKGWRVGRLGDLVENVIERIQPSSFTESHPYVPIECIEARSVCLINWQPGRNAKSSLVRFYKGDIIFGAMRPYFHKVCIAPFDGTTRTTAFVLRPVPSELAFTAFAVSRDETIDYATAHSEGSTIPYAKWAGSLQDMKIIIPMQNMREAYHRYIWPFIERMRTNLSANTLLAALRDALLPKLISCELRVKDAKKIVGRAL